MLEQLKFVKGAVGKKDLVPALTHFLIRDGRITGYNGKISLSAPIPLDVDCCPKATDLVKAIEACGETVQLHLTDTGKLSIRSGKFRAYVQTVNSELFPLVEPEGLTVDIDGNLLPALSRLYDFSSEDASRPWAAGVLLDGESAFASNNVILAECWLGYHFPYRVNVPRFTVKEMMRIGEEPIGLQLTATSATFHYTGDRWLRTQLASNDWPDISGMLARVPATVHSVPEVPAGLWEALATIEPFLDDASRVYMLGDRIATAPEEGTGVDFAHAPAEGLYNHKMLSLLADVAQRIDFTQYPAPLPWFGNSMRGMFVGMRP